MNQAKMQILRMIEEGKVTVEEGVKLLTALSARAGRPHRGPRPDGPPNDGQPAHGPRRGPGRHEHGPHEHDQHGPWSGGPRRGFGRGFGPHEHGPHQPGPHGPWFGGPRRSFGRGPHGPWRLFGMPRGFWHGRHGWQENDRPDRER